MVMLPEQHRVEGLFLVTQAVLGSTVGPAVGTAVDGRKVGRAVGDLVGRGDGKCWSSLGSGAI